MTIPESLGRWLLESGLLPGTGAVLTDALGPEAGSCGLLVSSEKAQPFLDGSRERECSCALLLRLPAQTGALRRAARARMEAIDAWIRSANAQNALPALDGGRVCLSVEARGPASLRYRTDAQAVYRLPVVITYWEG